MAILGFTFKENCPDTRNSKVFDIVRELREYGIEPIVTDPNADAEEARRLYGIRLAEPEALRELDAVILAVAHDSYRSLTLERLDALYQAGAPRILLDLKGLMDRKAFESAGYNYWRL